MDTNKKFAKRELVKKAVTLYLRGYTYAQIGEELNRSESVICRWKNEPYWAEEVRLQQDEINIIRENVLTENEDAINDYKNRLKNALEKIDAISENQLETARIGQETCLKFAKEFKETYEQEGIEIIASHAKAVRVMSELQKAINDALRTAVENIRFTTQIDTVYHYFKEKDSNETEITE